MIRQPVALFCRESVMIEPTSLTVFPLLLERVVRRNDDIGIIGADIVS